MHVGQTPDLIKADAKTISEILDTVKYKIDTFQREYKWGKSQIELLLEDLESKFSYEYKNGDERKDVANYDKYYMGSIIISAKDGNRYIVDGQQRLTSITLLLIYLNNMKKEKNVQDDTSIEDLIYSTKYGVKTYNLDIDGRTDCMDALFKNEKYDQNDNDESVNNIMERYDDIVNLFPEELKKNRLLYFIDWLIYNVIFVEIKTLSDDDAYTIFETMNDRGLNLTPSEMLKGYILSNMPLENRLPMDKLWRERITSINELKKNKDSDFFKSWLRAKYAQSLRNRSKDAENKDFEKIGTRFHTWVRDNKNNLGLKSQIDFYNFITHEFDFFSERYLEICNAAKNFRDELKHIFYIDVLGVPDSFYCSLLMAPLLIDDDADIINKKMNITAKFLEIFYVSRKMNKVTTSSSSISYTIFNIVKEIRNKNIDELSSILQEKINTFDVGINIMNEYRLRKQNKPFVRYILARITNHIENESGIDSTFEEYISKNTLKPFEIEHLWANKFIKHKTEFTDIDEFENYRNMLGALVLLKKGPNQAYGSDTYEEKLEYYYGENLLVKSLNKKCYEKNPNFTKYYKNANLPFLHHDEFTKKSIIQRQNLYQKICEEIWHSVEIY